MTAASWSPAGQYVGFHFCTNDYKNNSLIIY
jgi:hypothetical protein